MTVRVVTPVRVTAAGVGVLGAALLGGCATGDTGTADSGGGSPSHADGSYTAEGSYATPESVETVTVTVTLEGDIVTAVEVVGEPTNAESQRYQAEFIGGIAAEVVGKDIDEVSVSRVAGSSLTSGGFRQALDQIKADSAA
ncbi:hypothetical protein [Microbacterium aquimaris]|uniref:FMN-binding domain-containing protein n=1 Tax=Microbacterium aquimaris TaxID=459816 RepID=A0ABU5N6U2_9MICO|nr:hypothetical protein [Microbacterium aquimaris]MDZ8161809.1 hypothetical protein [Microbacterium aquimaris]